jgi:ABC-type transporter Mla MlaB component
VGIFSLFGKKERQPAETPADKASLRKKREEASPRVESPSSSESKSVQRKAAQATALKIDAIESEMSSEFVRPVVPPAGNTQPAPISQVRTDDAASKKPSLINPKKTDAWAPATFQPTLPAMGSTTEFLLSTETGSSSAAIAFASEATPIIEEAAILFANDQAVMAEHVLQGAVTDESLGHATSMVYHMLFDLYQITGEHDKFETLSIEFANKFETSPPAWRESDRPDAPSNAPTTGATPSISFSGALDGSIVKLLEKAQNLAEKSRVLRLEFARVTSVDPVGCGLLLSILKKLQKSGHDLILVGALDLVGKIRSILEVGRRDETEAPWLLLLEILRLLNLEKDFEEASIDYCVTFEVSPPAFVAPKNKVTMAIEEPTTTRPASDHFMMPVTVVEGTDKLIANINAFSANHNPAIIDCSQLQRVDFGAAGQLLTGLAPLTATGATLEFQNVNHLIAALFSVMGLKDIVQISLRKH